MWRMEDLRIITPFVISSYAIYKIIKKTRNWKVSLAVTIVPLILSIFALFITKNIILVTLLITFLIATILNLYLTFSIYKSWKEYNNSLHVQYGYDPVLTFQQYYSKNL
jgi:hypothetical protein